MPREKINHPHGYPAVVNGISPAMEWPVAEEPEHGRVTYDYVEPRLHVNWQKSSDFGEGHVQLSVEVHPQDIVSRAAEAESIIDQTAEPIAGVQTLLDTSIFHYTPVLTREEINGLIRVLRRARDAAYGSDE